MGTPILRGQPKLIREIGERLKSNCLETNLLGRKIYSRNFPGREGNPILFAKKINLENGIRFQQEARRKPAKKSPKT